MADGRTRRLRRHERAAARARGSTSARRHERAAQAVAAQLCPPVASSLWRLRGWRQLRPRRRRHRLSQWWARRVAEAVTSALAMAAAVAAAVQAVAARDGRGAHSSNGGVIGAKKRRWHQWRRPAPVRHQREDEERAADARRCRAALSQESVAVSADDRHEEVLHRRRVALGHISIPRAARQEHRASLRKRTHKRASLNMVRGRWESRAAAVRGR